MGSCAQIFSNKQINVVHPVKYQETTPNKNEDQAKLVLSNQQRSDVYFSNKQCHKKQGEHQTNIDYDDKGKQYPVSQSKLECLEKQAINKYLPKQGLQSKENVQIHNKGQQNQVQHNDPNNSQDKINSHQICVSDQSKKIEKTLGIKQYLLNIDKSLKQSNFMNKIINFWRVYLFQHLKLHKIISQSPQWSEIIYKIQIYMKKHIKSLQGIPTPNTSLHSPSNQPNFFIDLRLQVDDILAKNICFGIVIGYVDQFIKNNFSFDDSNKPQIIKLSTRIKFLCRDQPKSVVYLALFFVRACRVMEQKGASISQINLSLLKYVKLLKQFYSPLERTQQQTTFTNRTYEQSQLQQVKNITHKYEPKILKFEANCTPQLKQQLIQDLIMHMVEKGKQYHGKFKEIVQEICMGNNGFYFKSNLKLKDKTNVESLLRVKQKLIGDKLQTFYKNKTFQAKNIVQLRQLQLQYFKQVIKRIYQQMNQIQFNVTDILRGKCLFNQVQQINNTCKQIVSKVQNLSKEGQAVQIVQINNRLTKITKDLVLKIRIEQLVCQFQIALRFKEQQNYVHHKMYEIERSKIFTPISMLYAWSVKLVREFWLAARGFVDARSGSDKAYYEEKFNKFVRVVKMDIKEQFQCSAIPVALFQNKIPILMTALQSITFDQQQLKISEQNQAHNYSQYCLVEGSLQKAEQTLKIVPVPSLSLQNKLTMIKIILKKRITKDPIQKIVSQQILANNDLFTSIPKQMVLLQVARICILQSNNLSIGLDYLNDVDTICKNQQNAQSQRWIQEQVLMLRCQAYLRKEMYQESVDVCLDLGSKLGKQTNNYMLVKCIYLKSKAYLALGNKNFASAFQLFLLSIYYKQHLLGKFSLQVIKDYAQMARLYKQMGRYLQAQYELVRLTKFIGTKYGEEHLLYLWIARELAAIYVSTNKINWALQICLKLQTICLRVAGKQSTEYISILKALSIIYNSLNNTQKTIQLCRQIRDISQKIYPIGIHNSQAKQNVAKTYFMIGDYKKSLQLTLQTLQYHKLIQVKSVAYYNGLQQIYTFLGQVNIKMNKYDQALNFYNDALDLSKFKQHQISQLTIKSCPILIKIANIYANMKIYQQCLQTLGQALQIYKKVQGKQSINVARIYQYMLKVYNLMQDFQKVYQLFQQASAIYNMLHGSRINEDYYAILKLMINICYQRHKLDVAVRLSAQNLDVLSATHHLKSLPS